MHWKKQIKHRFIGEVKNNLPTGTEYIVVIHISHSLWVFSNQQILGNSSWHIKLKCIGYSKVIVIYPKCYNWSKTGIKNLKFSIKTEIHYFIFLKIYLSRTNTLNFWIFFRDLHFSLDFLFIGVVWFPTACYRIFFQQTTSQPQKSAKLCRDTSNNATQHHH